ncbi:unnamed protein product [Effrenium voratum]|uniref:Inositol polyphosphate-related phosphatase domain-containing protein n=1 Tax=Effrenium voratum TaxID=2562239 RepID=A0AA36HRJ9_9DINO|nr:unnamed protein product [Effrenium voratum]CAJ1460005.1 unnamed protein product [Effrenium voratum]
MLLCTWNLGCKDAEAPKAGAFKWLGDLCQRLKPEILALGLQELNPRLLPEVEQTVVQVLNAAVPGAEFQVTSEHCGSYLPLLLLSPVKVTAEAAALRFTFDKHEAGHGKLEARNEMFAQIAERFPARDGHLLVVLGDLNYRLQGLQSFTEPTKKTPLASRCPKFLAEFEDAVAKCYSGEVVQLLETCQLHGPRRSYGFEEAPVRFHPTYKRAKADSTEGVPRYDLEEPRMPGWCDRILWRCGQKVEVEVSEYSAVESADFSDHRPVYAVLDVR